jgi:ESF2/ABP1 family protein
MQSEESHELTDGISEEKESKETMKSQKADRKKKKLKEKLLKEASKADNRGVCYLSRIPPHMDHVRLRHILAQYGELGRIYLAPEDSEAQVHRKRAGGFRGQRFSEGWVEFAKKSVAKRVADMLNGEQIGGKKKSSVYYDIWNIKYLTKFKWDDLTEEIAYKSAIREQKLNMVLSAAKREKDFYLSKIEKSRAMTEIDARMEKKRKIQEESGSNAEAAPVFPPRAIFQFRQKKSIENETSQSKPGLSTDFLASVSTFFFYL